jgi:pimeloyl-ACP methyl ester carboxylesterase
MEKTPPPAQKQLAGKTLAAAIPNARTIVLPGAGHMMMT